ncbi:hypothetical protein [Acidisoma sp. 7E03]
MRWHAAAVALCLVALPAVAQAAGLCAAGATSDALRPLPESAAPAARQVFGLAPEMPAAVVAQTTVYRCDGGRTLICTTGANLPCGKAKTARHLPAVSQWCARNPNADFVPAYVTGNETVYSWRCHAGRAVAGQRAPLDARGFFADYWKSLPSAAP